MWQLVGSDSEKIDYSTQRQEGGAILKGGCELLKRREGFGRTYIPYIPYIEERERDGTGGLGVGCRRDWGDWGTGPNSGPVDGDDDGLRRSVCGVRAWCV